MSKRRNLARRIGLVGFGLTLGVGLWLARDRGTRAMSPPLEGIQLPSAGPEGGKVRPVGAEAIGARATVVPSLPSSAEGAPSTDDRFDPGVRKVVGLRYKGLLSSNERDEQRALLSDSALLERAAKELIQPKDMPPREDQLRRINLVKFLVEAIAWKDNPSLPLAIAKVSQVVLSENYHVESSQWFQRSLAGDKIELLMGMSDHQPAALAALMDAARAGRNAKLVSFAMRQMGVVEAADGEPRSAASRAPRAISQ
jgi:hypothetical protein